MSEQIPTANPSELTQPMPAVEEWSDPTYGYLNPEAAQNTYLQHLGEYNQGEVTTTLEAVYSSNDSFEQKSLETEVIANGTYKGHAVGMREYARNANADLADRTWLAEVIHRAPEVAETIASNDVVGFHATGSSVLAGVVEGGALLSGAELDNQGKHTVTATHDAVKGMSQISFGTLAHTEQNFNAYGGADTVKTDAEVIDELQAQIAGAKELADEAYGEKSARRSAHMVANFEAALEDFKTKPGSLAATMLRNQFPVAFGVRRDFVRAAEQNREKGSIHYGQSHFGEFRPAAESIPIDDLPVIAVPADKVQPVQELLAMFNHSSVSVVPIEALQRENELTIQQ